MSGWVDTSGQAGCPFSNLEPVGCANNWNMQCSAFVGTFHVLYCRTMQHRLLWWSALLCNNLAILDRYDSPAKERGQTSLGRLVGLKSVPRWRNWLELQKHPPLTKGGVVIWCQGLHLVYFFSSMSGYWPWPLQYIQDVETKWPGAGGAGRLRILLFVFFICVLDQDSFDSCSCLRGLFSTILAWLVSQKIGDRISCVVVLLFSKLPNFNRPLLQVKLDTNWPRLHDFCSPSTFSRELSLFWEGYVCVHLEPGIPEEIAFFHPSLPLLIVLPVS